MKDPLEYTEEELKAMPVEDLKVLKKLAEKGKSLFNTKQLVEKTLINGLYGAMANKWFPLFNETMAGSITANGRYFIQKLANYIEEALQNLLPQDKEYIVYGDTDSCVYDTIIRTSVGDYTIEQIYNMLQGEIETRGKDNFIKHISDDITTPSISKKLKLENKPINYIMKHKVKKRMFKIKCNGDEVIITEDHSIMVLRNGGLIEVKPTEIQKNDKLIKIID